MNAFQARQDEWPRVSRAFGTRFLSCVSTEVDARVSSQRRPIGRATYKTPHRPSSEAVRGRHPEATLLCGS